MRISLILLLVTLHTYAWGCYVPPAEQHVSNIELITRTKNIVLAKVINISTAENNWDTTYSFQTLTVLKGNLPRTFQIKGFPESRNNEEPHFGNHKDEQFWKNDLGRNSGRSFNYPDCIIHPQFTLNGVYLIFYDTPYHSKSFERIVDVENDKWLKYVREKTVRP